jgi:hypothetical protein
MLREKTRFVLLSLLPLAFATACASTGGAAGSSASILTQEEMTDAPASNVYEVVDRLRPRWLQVRAPMTIDGQAQILVYLNQSYLGGPEVLREFEVDQVQRIRYLDGPRASGTLSGYPSDIPIAGAIVLETSG